MNYLIIPDPKTKPVRYIVLIDDKIFARGLKKSDAQRVVAALISVSSSSVAAAHFKAALAGVQSKG